MSETSANLVEVFSSIQGEGPEIGTRTLFVRFGECDLRCRWCDSPGTWKRASSARFERSPGLGFTDAEFDTEPNPISIDRLLEVALRLDLPDHRWVSLTGGEPLLQVEAVAAAAQALSGQGPGIFLETHGLCVEALEQVVARIDLVSMDWKLVSDVRRADDPRGGEVLPFHDTHARFLEIARQAPKVVVKLVITRTSTDEELDLVFARVAEIHPEACVVLQPVTPSGVVRDRPPPERMQALERRASKRLGDVRVIPQTHPLVGVA